MSKSKPYEEQKPGNRMVSEATMMYEASTHSVDDFVASIPVDLMQQLAEHAIAECKSGRCIPHEQVEDLIDRRMGWK